MPFFFIIIFFFFIIIIFFFDITQVGLVVDEEIAAVGLGVAARAAPETRDALPMIAAASVAVVNLAMMGLLHECGISTDTFRATLVP